MNGASMSKANRDGRTAMVPAKVSPNFSSARTEGATPNATSALERR